MTSAIYLRHINLKIPRHRWRFNRAENRKQLKSRFWITGRANQNVAGPEAISTPQQCWRQCCHVKMEEPDTKERDGWLQGRLICSYCLCRKRQLWDTIPRLLNSWCLLMQHINRHQCEERSSNPPKWLMTTQDSDHVAPTPLLHLLF